METEIKRNTSNSGYLADIRTKPAFIFRYKLRARIAANAAREYLRNGASSLRILDFGSANGLALLELRSLLPGGTYVGVEYSDEMLENVRKLPSDTRIIKGDVLDLPKDVKDGSFDIVCALAILEHLSDPFKALKEAKGALRRGGIFVATSITPFWDYAAKYLKAPHAEWHITKISRKDMINMAKECRMELLTCQKALWAPLASLPYIGIMPSTDFCLKIDRAIAALKVFDFLFMNNYMVARKVLS